jgi:cytochrome P460
MRASVGRRTSDKISEPSRGMDHSVVGSRLHTVAERLTSPSLQRSFEFFTTLGGGLKMNSGNIPPIAIIAASFAVVGGIALAAQDRYSLQVPGGLAFSEFRGYEDWQIIAASHNGDKIATILGNPAMIEAFKAGIPDNGKPVPDGARMAKIHWTAKKAEDQPGEPVVPGPLHDIDFMVKDSQRFADSGGWGWAAFDYDNASETFRPSDASSTPPQEHDAKCGFACHTIVAAKDYVFTAYPKR